MTPEKTTRGPVTLEDILGLKDIPAYLTAKEIAKILRIDGSTARRRLENGEFERAFKMGTEWRVPSRFLERQLRNAEETGEFAA